MASQLIYFTGSLPYLVFGNKAPMSMTAFDADASRLLAPAEAELLRHASLLPEKAGENAPDVVRRYQDWERALRNAWLEIRKKMYSNAADYRRESTDVYAEISGALTQAAAAPDPLEAERILDRARWTRLDELKAGHSFDLAAAAIYRMQLAILLKYDVLTPAAGGAALDRIVQAVNTAGETENHQ